MVVGPHRKIQTLFPRQWNMCLAGEESHHLLKKEMNVKSFSFSNLLSFTNLQLLSYHNEKQVMLL